MNEDEFFRATAAGLMGRSTEMQEQFAAMMESGAPPGPPPFAAPVEVTSRVKKQIKALPIAPPRSKSAVWMVHTLTDYEYEGTGSTCFVYQIVKEHGSNGLSLPESDGFGMSLAMCAMMDPTNSMANRPPLLLGTIAKACLNPGSMSMFGGNEMMSNAASSFDIRPSRPRKILFTTRGEVEMLRDDLENMGIKQLDVADQALIRSFELYASAMNDVNRSSGHIERTMNADPSALGHELLAHNQAMYEPYVSEEPMPLGSFVPPSEPGDLPARWYARPPEDINEWKPTALLGWRTNLERAILREDAHKVKEIVSKRNANDVREFVECRMLLTKCAQRGLIEACKLLMNECKANVEGAQAPDAEPWWIEVQNHSGNFGSLTPLHQAARNGQLQSLKLLLEHGAEINRIDKCEIRGSALHHAVSTGQIDCVQFLCENGADHTYEGHGGEALDISELVAGGDEYRRRVQEKVQQILREFDTRCSSCRHPNPSKFCPCRKERYCGPECQRARWKRHKKYHKEVLEG